MSELFSKLGVDWKLLIAQVVNFFILFWVLRRFAYKPILKTLERRRETVEKGMKDAKSVEERLASLEKERGKVIDDAHAQAHAIVETATKDAAAFTVRSREEAKRETAAMIAAARSDVERIKDTVVAEATADIADLVVAGTERIIRIKLDGAADRELVNKTLTRAKG